MSNRSETFGRLLKGAINSIATYEGTTAPFVEEELAEKVGLAGSAIQRYKTGYLPPEPRTVEIIAEAAVRRGFFSREWLQRFLHAARYHQADKLLDQLCPIGPARSRSPRVYQNLPAPTYSQFVERKEVSAEVLEGLSKRSAAVIIVGLGGNGKTSLAREAADYCLKGEDGQALFDAAAWVSDKDRPGTTNLSIVLDEIARTLDYPGFTQFEHDEKRREVEQLLRRQRVLVCVDNCETITDGALLSWLLNLPEPSKALITTREYRREYRRGGWPVELRGMSDEEAQALIIERLKVLRIEKSISNPTQLEPLVKATGGNPKAIEITLGLIKYGHQSLERVVDDLYAARGELFDDLFSRAWVLLGDAARKILLVMTYFPSSASIEALRATSDVKGFAFEQAVERLMDLALLDIQQTSLFRQPRYTLHPLVRSFAKTKYGEYSNVLEGSRERWCVWFIELSAQVGYCWYDLSKMDVLDPEQENILEITNWITEMRYYHKAIDLDKGVSYYYFVRGLWHQKHAMNLLRIDAARHIGDLLDEAKALSYLVETLCKQGNVTEAQHYFPRLSELLHHVEIPDDARFSLQRAIAFLEMGLGRYSSAVSEWEKAVQLSQLNRVEYTFARRWKAACLIYEGNFEGAQKILLEILPEAEQSGSQRAVSFCLLKLATIYLEFGDLSRAASTLERAGKGIRQYQDREYLAELQRLYARLYVQYGDISAALKAFTEAADLFERLGMRRELTEAREELRRLEEMGEAPAA